MGFLKSGTKDADSVSKCEKFALRMVGDPLPPPPPPPVNAIQCTEQMPMYVYFDWDSAVPPPDASVGHTDRSGSDSYNFPLSVERAQAVARMMEGAGISASSMTIDGRGETERKVETLDGERNPSNRRVEINAMPATR